MAAGDWFGTGDLPALGAVLSAYRCLVSAKWGSQRGAGEVRNPGVVSNLIVILGSMLCFILLRHRAETVEFYLH